jgi:hypothetical protein
MTVPVYTLGANCLVTNCHLFDKFHRRGPFLVGCTVPVMVNLMCAGTPNPYAGYAGKYILAIGKLCIHASLNYNIPSDQGPTIFPP